MKGINQRLFAIVTLISAVAVGAYGYLSTAWQRVSPVGGHVDPLHVSRKSSAHASYAMYYPSAFGSRTLPNGPGGSAPSSSGAVPEVPVSTGYIDGVYTGRRESAYYGIVQVQAVIRGGNLVDVRILSYPNDNGTSRYINSVALPRLIKESLREQGSHVNFVSGATFTSEAYHLSLHLALVQAVN